ncbi:MAG: hypothetical protein AUJ72_00195 [Candidatus Omnitrophica bacterium CG1_02_46_14]|nr:MAG: hypothetical protein AUJ72_00195 [Candidatus Omnitrophica bacterium CG1_02_46_14]
MKKRSILCSTNLRVVQGSGHRLAVEIFQGPAVGFTAIARVLVLLDQAEVFRAVVLKVIVPPGLVIIQVSLFRKSTPLIRETLHTPRILLNYLKNRLDYTTGLHRF